MDTQREINVLLVEDNPQDVQRTQEALRGGKLTFRVVHVDSLALAVDLLNNEPCDVVLLDLDLPDSQGLETLRRIHGINRDLPVVIAGPEDDELAFKAVKEGAQDYLVKSLLQAAMVTRAIRNAIERSRSQRALRHSEERFHLLVEEVQDYAIFLLDLDGHVATWNEGAKRITRYLEEEVLGQPFSLFFPKEDVEQGKPAHLLETAARESKVRDEGWRLRKDGSNFWAEVALTAMHEPGFAAPFEGRERGKLTGFLTITRDITERRIAEESLRQSDALFRSVAGSISVILWVLDPMASKILYVSPAYETIFQLTCASLYANLSTYLESVHPEDYATARAFLERLVRDGQSEVEYRLLRADGSVRWLSATGRAVRNQAGVIQSYAGISEDVTAKKQVDELAARLAAIVETAEDAIICQTLEGDVFEWNPGAVRLYGYTREEMLGQSLLILYPPNQEEEFARIMEQVRLGKPVPSYQTRRRRKDDQLVDVLLSVAPLINAKQQILGASVIAHDMSEILKLEQQFRQAQKMDAVGQLAGGVAHDFNNLLTIISGYSDIVLNSLVPTNPIREFVTEIRHAGERAASLTQQLLAFSRKTVLQPRVLDLNEVFTDSLKLLRRLVGEDVELTTVFSSSLGLVSVDPSHFEQAIVNLAVNARDAIPRGGKLTFETANVELDADYCLKNAGVSPGPFVRVTVSDNGCGMSEETKARIFEPFFTTKEVGKGTGLGLAMVYGFIKQSGGHIAVTSTPNQGTTFHLYFPQVQGEVLAGPARQGPKPMPKGSETILLVEDESVVRAVASHVLQMCGYTVLEASHGGEALRMVESYEGPIHLLLTDVVMPGMGGPMVAEKVAHLKPGIKTVFMSGYTDDTVVRNGVVGTETHFLQKPYTPSAVAQTIREVLDR